ncbi:MAG: hypothetical protein RSA84_18710, partial [Acinetobacter sp.]
LITDLFNASILFETPPKILSGFETFSHKRMTQNQKGSGITNTGIYFSVYFLCLRLFKTLRADWAIPENGYF